MRAEKPPRTSEDHGKSSEAPFFDVAFTVRRKLVDFAVSLSIPIDSPMKFVRRKASLGPQNLV